MNAEELYKKHEKVIEDLASKYKCQVFSFFDEDDIMQEVRMICYSALEDFNENLANVKTYLTRCVSNRLKNFKRDKYFRFENICLDSKCPMYNVFSGECTSNSYPEICDVLNKSKNKMQKQIAATNPVSINDEEDEFEFESKDINFTQLRGINSAIRKNVVSASGDFFGERYDRLLDSDVKRLDKEEVAFFYSVAEKVVYGKEKD